MTHEFKNTITSRAKNDGYKSHNKIVGKVGRYHVQMYLFLLELECIWKVDFL
jgi:hypothetical protein